MAPVHLRLLGLGLVLGSAIAEPLRKPTTRIAGDDDDTPLPIVIWHGLGDNYASDGIKSVGEIAEEVNPGTFVYPIRIEESASADRDATWFGNVTQQIEKVCADLAKHPILSTAPAVDAIGFSQGGQFLRGYVERCNFPPVRSLVTFGSQHNGISDVSMCKDNFLCKTFIRGNVWGSFAQSRIVPAQYFRNPDEYDKYLENSNFLADINNERALKNETYRENIGKLANFVMYLFEEDTTVIPKESSWFEEVNGTESTPLRATPLYLEDWLGLRELDQRGGLHFKKTPGAHMQISEEVLRKTMKEFFGPLEPESSLSANDEL